jgi:hypothetical protein
MRCRSLYRAETYLCSVLCIVSGNERVRTWFCQLSSGGATAYDI